MKCHLSLRIPPIQCVRNVKEISCVLGKGNAHEIVPYTVSGNPQEMYKFHVVRNVHTMNGKCDLSYTFLGISQPRKFKISSSDTYIQTYIHTCIYTHIHTDRQTDRHTYIHTYIHTKYRYYKLHRLHIN